MNKENKSGRSSGNGKKNLKAPSSSFQHTGDHPTLTGITELNWTFM
jgi:hypothetical protein